MSDLQILSAALDSALVKREIRAVYQPQVDPTTGALVAVEGLARWDRPGGESVAPEVFIPLAEQTGLIHEVGRFMLDECLNQVDRWRVQRRPVEVAVNVSPLQLTSDRFADYLIEQLTAHDWLGRPFTIEITETLPVWNIEAIVPRLQKLRAAGVGVSLDDYGTGHASLAQLDTLPLSEVKLDRSLIQSGTAAHLRVLRQAVGRARELGLRVVAEGIETPAHLELARSLSCDRVQGYLFAPPMSVEDLDQLLVA